MVIAPAGGQTMFGLGKWIAYLGGRSDQPPASARTKEWCVLALLYAAARSDAATDAAVTAEEEVTLDSLASRTRTLFGISQERLDAYLADHRALLKGRNSVSVLVEAACDSLPNEDGLAEAIFIQCVDMVMADRQVVGLEDEFLRDLASRLRISGARLRDIMEVMRWKNELRAAGQ